MNTKQLLLIAFGALLLVGLILQITPSGNRRYRADSMIIATPYTNAFFARSFEADIIRKVPGILALHVTPTFSAITSPGVLAITNGVAIRINAFGLTPADAQRAANDGADQIGQITLTNYGITSRPVAPATSARKFSYFHDTLQPAVIRLFNH